LITGGRLERLKLTDTLSKVAHFIEVKSTNSTSELSHVFIKDILRLHGVPTNIILGRDAKFSSKFWKDLFVVLVIDLDFSKKYHPQIDGQKQKVNMILENMLRIYVMHQQLN